MLLLRGGKTTLSKRDRSTPGQYILHTMNNWCSAGDAVDALAVPIEEVHAAHVDGEADLVAGDVRRTGVQLDHQIGAAVRGRRGLGQRPAAELLAMENARALRGAGRPAPDRAA